MSRTDDLRAAGEAARTRIEDARRALAETRDAVGGGRATAPQEAQAQLATLRRAIEADLGALRGRVGDGTGDGRGLRTGLASGAVGLVGLAGAGLLARRAVRRGAERRADDRRAAALAAALARRDGGDASGRSGAGLVVALLGAAAAGAALLAARRGGAPGDDELWSRP